MHYFQKVIRTLYFQETLTWFSCSILSIVVMPTMILSCCLCCICLRRVFDGCNVMLSRGISANLGKQEASRRRELLQRASRQRSPRRRNQRPHAGFCPNILSLQCSGESHYPDRLDPFVHSLIVVYSPSKHVLRDLHSQSRRVLPPGISSLGCAIEPHL
jgi:hypothetical protein